MRDTAGARAGRAFGVVIGGVVVVVNPQTLENKSKGAYATDCNIFV